MLKQNRGSGGKELNCSPHLTPPLRTSPAAAASGDSGNFTQFVPERSAFLPRVPDHAEHAHGADRVVAGLQGSDLSRFLFFCLKWSSRDSQLRGASVRKSARLETPWDDARAHRSIV